MRTLVTGASGFVGLHCLDLMDAQPLDDRVDLRDLAQLCDAIGQARPEAVIHLAAQSSVAASLADPVATLEVNFNGTLNLLMALDRVAFRGRLLYVSSGDCYGLVDDESLPVTEIHPLKPRNPYAVSKVAAEVLCLQWSRTHDFEIVVARPFNQVGPGQSPKFVISDLGRQCAGIRRGVRPPEVTVGDFEITRDFTDVRDGVRAFDLLLGHGRNGEAYNVCSDVEHSIKDIVEAYAGIVGHPLRIQQDKDRLRRAEQRRMRGSFAKLQDHTGWRPSIPLVRTLTDIIEYWNEQDKEQ